MFLLQVPFVKNSNIQAGIFIIFKNVPDLKNVLIPNLDLSKKIGKAVIK